MKERLTIWTLLQLTTIDQQKTQLGERLKRQALKRGDICDTYIQQKTCAHNI